MSNALALFDPKQMQVPAHLMDDDGWKANIKPPVTVPSLAYTGKVWTVVANGERTPLMKRDADGDEAPVQVLRTFILDYAARRGRAYYPGTYDPAATAAPTCWSDDGEKPHEAVEDKQSKTCASCKWAAKGSRIADNGKATTACGQHRMLAVVLANKPDMQPLRLKLAITSDWDKNEENAAQGYFAFQQYTNFLTGRGVNNTAKVVTKMRFDPAVAYPKVLFSPDRWATAEEVAAFKPRLGTPEVTSLLAGTYTPAGVDGTPIAGSDPDAEMEAKSIQRTPVKASLDEDDEDDSAAVAAKAAEEKAAAKAAKAAKAAADAKAAKAAEAEKAAAKAKAALEDDDEVEIVKPVKAAKPAAAAVPTDVAAVLADWDDE